MVAWKRFLFLFHRWVGIVLCLIFVLWFVSGIFMMYVEFPQLTRAERLVGAASLDFSSAKLTAGEAIGKLKRGDFEVIGTPSRNERLEISDPQAPLTAVSAVHLDMLFGRPVYLVQVRGGAQPRIVFADTGEVLREVTSKMAVNAATEFASRSNVDAKNASYDSLLQTDQWTVSAALNDHRPLHRVLLNDANGTEYYVSSRTGAVVRDADTKERVLNYFAAVTHWLYPTFIRKYPDGWAWMVDILSGVGAIFAVSGLWIGILRWRRKRPPGKRAVPYRGLMRWHYFTGIIFGVCLLTWVFSGLLSMNPGKLNPSRSASTQQAQLYTGKPFDVADFPVPVLPENAIDADLIHYEGQPFFSVTLRNGERHVVFAGEGASQAPTAKQMIARAADLLPGIALASTTVLTSYDDYYYTRHPERGEKPLPVVRVQFADVDKTWFHLDPLTGQVLERSTSTNRMYRWLYNGLHSWDIRWLWEHRPLWDIAVITFMLGGILLSLLGVVISVRRLRY